MPIYFGSNKIKEIYNGSVPIKEVYNGSNKVFGAGAVVEYGMTSRASYNDPLTMSTFLPDFETSTTLFNVYKPLTGDSTYNYYSGGSGAWSGVVITDYKEKNSFVYRAGYAYANMSYKGMITVNGIKYQEYSGTSYYAGTLTLYLPDGFILNTSWFLHKIGTATRGSDFSYTYSGITHEIRSRHKVNLLTGEEQ